MKFDGRHIHRDQRGQSLVEFALVLPMLLVVMLMITEFGRALFQYNVLAQATRAGARQAAVMGRTTAVNQAIANAENFIAQSGIDQNNTADVTAEILDNFNGSGRSVIRVRAEMPFTFVFQGPLPANADGSATVSPSALTLVAENTMHAEQFVGSP